MDNRIKLEPNAEHQNSVFEFSVESIKHELSSDDATVIEIDERIFYDNSCEQLYEELAGADNDSHRNAEDADESFVFVDEIVKEEPIFHDNLINELTEQHPAKNTLNQRSWSQTHETGQKSSDFSPTKEKPRYYCEYCPEIFEEQWLFDRHQKVHGNEQTFDCKICLRKFATQLRLAAHERIHSGQKPYECPICHQRFNQKHTLALHGRIHSGEKPYKCEHCDMRFRLKQHLDSHKKVRSASSSHQLSRNRCGGVAKNRIVPMELIAEHSIEIRVFECYLCHINCYKTELRQHVKEVHCGETIYTCAKCKRKFVNKYKMERHMRLHTDQPELQCSICGRQFLRKSSLTEHIVTHVKSYKCTFCPKLLSTKHIFRTHLKTHTGLRPFACEFETCPKTFLKRGDMVRHMRVHTGERPYKCNYCSKLFTRNHLLTEHVENMHTKN